MMVALPAGCGAGFRDGPLAINDGKGAVVGSEAEEGQRIVYGLNVITNQGDGPVTNVEAVLLPDGEDDAPGISFEPAQVVDIAANDLGYLAGGTWPYGEWAKHAKPLEGYSIPPKSRKIELLLIMTVKSKGQWFWPKTRIEYDYDGRRYAEEVTNGFALCAPAPCNPEPSLP